MDRNARILISGAGIAGLTASIWLSRAGFRPLIVEKAPKIRADGFIITLSKENPVKSSIWAAARDYMPTV